jgi:hypothetical protein
LDASSASRLAHKSAGEGRGSVVERSYRRTLHYVLYVHTYAMYIHHASRTHSTHIHYVLPYAHDHTSTYHIVPLAPYALTASEYSDLLLVYATYRAHSVERHSYVLIYIHAIFIRCTYISSPVFVMIRIALSHRKRKYTLSTLFHVF